MSLLDRLLGQTIEKREDRVGLVQLYETWSDGTEHLGHDFLSYVHQGYKSNGVVFAAITARMLMLSEIEFTFQRLSNRERFGSPALQPLEAPWPNGTTGELVARAEQDASLAGNFYVHKVPDANRLQRLRPDWVTIVTDGRTAQGYVYQPDGPGSGNKPTYIPAEEMAHWTPIPDPEKPFRGMSWLTPVVREINADTGMTKHKDKFMSKAATPNLLIKVAQTLAPDVRERLEADIARKHEGIDNAWKTMLLEGGADAQVVGSNFKDMSFSVTQAAGEGRIAIAGGVGLADLLGLTKDGETAKAPDKAAIRSFVDMTCRPLWRGLAASMAPLVKVPNGARLWYDDSHIPALKEDGEARSSIQKTKAETIGLLIRSGYVPENVAKVIDNDEPLTNLVHTGKIPTTLYVGGDPNSVGEPNESPDDQGTEGDLNAQEN